jgi:hypothetical protein
VIIRFDPIQRLGRAARVRYADLTVEIAVRGNDVDARIVGGRIDGVKSTREFLNAA